jgi:membrane-associated phospholipid phosphatase
MYLMRSDIHTPAQPGTPEEAPGILPLKMLLIYTLAGALFCALATLGFVWLAAGVLANRFIIFDERTILWMHNHLFEGPFNLTNYSFLSGHSMGAIACCRTEMTGAPTSCILSQA